MASFTVPTPSEATLSLLRVHEDLLQRIFIYLDFIGLMRAEEVCRHFRGVIRRFDRANYGQVCQSMWAGIEFNKPSELDVFERILKLPREVMIKTLSDCGVDRAVQFEDINSTEEMNLARLIRAHALFHRSGIVYPAWSLCLSNMKASCVFTKVELRRRTITVEEMCLAGSWRFKFVDVEEIDDEYVCIYYPDFTAFSNLMPDHVYTWTVSLAR